mmetsp:Transcript_52476/g.139702  ORF Transcript_52476/g.139702 Transcript_52476/m.139702 type:complete len:252 (+) Transcript_52476:819-1574(+)
MLDGAHGVTVHPLSALGKDVHSSDVLRKPPCTQHQSDILVRHSTFLETFFGNRVRHETSISDVGCFIDTVLCQLVASLSLKFEAQSYSLFLYERNLASSPGLLSFELFVCPVVVEIQGQTSRPNEGLQSFVPLLRLLCRDLQLQWSIWFRQDLVHAPVEFPKEVGKLGPEGQTFPNSSCLPVNFVSIPRLRTLRLLIRTILDGRVRCERLDRLESFQSKLQACTSFGPRADFHHGSTRTRMQVFGLLYKLA